MDNILEFITEYYLVFIIISAVLILALIGYFADKFTNKDVKISNSHVDDSVETL